MIVRRVYAYGMDLGWVYYGSTTGTLRKLFIDRYCRPVKAEKQ